MCFFGHGGDARRGAFVTEMTAARPGARILVAGLSLFGGARASAERDAAASGANRADRTKEPTPESPTPVV